MPRFFAAVLVLAAALAAQDPELPPLELPRADAWFENPEHADAPAALVVVKRGHAPWIRTIGHVDAEGRAPLRPDSWVPLETLTDLLLREALRIERDEHGLDLSTRLAESAPAAFDGLAPWIGALSWTGVLADRSSPAPHYERWLEDDAMPRPLSEVLAAHAFEDPRGERGRGDLATAFLQHALESRRGQAWADLVEGPVAASLGAALSAGRPSEAPFWVTTSSFTGPWAPREVAAAFNAWIRLDTVDAWLDELLRRDPQQLLDRALGGFGEQAYVRAAASGGGEVYGVRRQSYAVHRVRIQVWPEHGAALFDVSLRSSKPPGDSAAHDLFGAPGESADQWNTAIGLGAPSRPQLAAAVLGSWRGKVETLGGALEVGVDVRSPDPEAIDWSLDGEDVVESAVGDGTAFVVTVPRGGATLLFRLEYAGERLRGYVEERIGPSHLPWPVDLRRGGPVAEPLPAIATLVEELGLEARLSHAPGAVPAARALGLWTATDGAWVAVAGRPDPDTDAELTPDDSIPFGALSRAVTRRAVDRAEEDGRIDLDATATHAGDGWRAEWRRAALRDLLSGTGLPIYFRHVGDPATRRSFAAVVGAHGFVWPDWILPDPESEFGLGLVLEAIGSGAAGERIDLATVIDSTDGLAVATGSEPHRVRIVDGGTTRAVRFSEVPLAFDVEGTADAALRLGADLLERRLRGADARPWGARDLGDSGDRDLPAIGWEDDRAGAIRLRVWPALGLVLFAFDAGGDAGWIDAVTEAVLERAEPARPTEPRRSRNRLDGLDDEPAARRYAGAWQAGEETLEIELLTTLPVPEIRVGGRRLDPDLRRYDRDDIVLRAPLGDGRELWIAVRKNFFGTGLTGVGWLVEPGAAMLPYRLALPRR